MPDRTDNQAPFVCVSCDGPSSGGVCAHCRTIIQQRSGEAGLARARQALKPLADALEEWGDDESDGAQTLWEHPLAQNIALGDIRRAKDAYEALAIKDTQV